MPVTFNTNNNYNVEIITEPDTLSLVNPGVHGAPVAIKYSSSTNTPYIELKITPAIYQYPLLAGNMNFDSLYRFIDHRAQNNVNNSCTPLPTPHNANTTNTFGATNFPGTLANGSVCALPQITANVTNSFQGPFESHRSFGAIYTDQLANGVAWTKVIWVEVYEDDNGQMVNTSFSPELNEDLASWQLWNPNDPSRPITNNIYPQYIRAFVFLEFAPSGPGGLVNNVDIFIDIDEDEPVYGCTNPSANNYTSNATIDDGSCIFPPPQYTIRIFDNYNNAVRNNLYTNFFTSHNNVGTFNQFTNMTGNLIRNYKVITPPPINFNNTYAAGDGVNEVFVIDLFPINPIIGNTSYEAVYNYNIYPGGPNSNLDDTDPDFGWGDATNNLTAASIRFLNAVGTDAEKPVYVDPSDPSFQKAEWVGDTWTDYTGKQPSTIVTFNTDFLTALDNNGNTINIELGNHPTIEEHYLPSSDPELLTNPAYEYFPYKLTLTIEFDFVMPNHHLDIILDLDHNIENQGGGGPI